MPTQTIVVPLPKPRPNGVVLRPSFEVYSDYGEGNTVAAELRNAPPKLYDFDRASLRDVLRTLADDAGIPFVALQESSTVDSTLVTFTLTTSPFQALETVAEANGVALSYQNGVWFMRPINEKELIGRIYKLKYNPQENVQYNAGGSQSGATTSVGDTGGGGTGGGVPSMNINIQGASNVFQVETPKIIEEIKALLGIPSNAVSATMATEASVENFGTLPAPSGLNPSGSRLMAKPSTDTGPQVIYNADSGTVYVVATRQQHEWVEGFLSAVDRPQALIGIEVKFFETNRDPEKDLGVDWSNTLGPNNPFTVSAQLTGQVNANTVLNPALGALGAATSALTAGTTATSTSTSTSSGTSTTATASPTTTTSTGPFSAVLNTSQVSVSVQALMQDRSATLVQYPRVLTLNNREVVIRSVENEPVLASTATVSSGGAGTTAQSVSYLPIGTIINVLPKTMPDNSVVLNVAITVSSIVSQKNIGGNLYPVASSRVYNAALQVDSGYTLAVGGLESAADFDTKNGVPFFQDIPGVGALFRSKSHNRTKQNLVIFITPTIINNRAATEGISQTPESVLPVRPDEPMPPALTPTGHLAGGPAAVPGAIAWLERQVLFFRQVNRENRADRKSIKQLEEVINTAELLVGETQRMENENPAIMNKLISEEEHLRDIVRQFRKVLHDSQHNLID